VQYNIKQLLADIQNGNFLMLAKGITLLENELEGYEELLLLLHNKHKPTVVGITGPPGAGKSTIVNALLKHWLALNKKIAVLAIDPSSPFNYGALLGDRIRMNEFYTHPHVFIRSLATRGALGGLNAKIIEISDLVKNAPFDYIIIETVGVGQSEVEISGLADCTVVALVPEAGDEIQTLKAGIMEIADIFVVNKADRDAAESLYRNLRLLIHEKIDITHETAVIKTIASQQNGIDELALAIEDFLRLHSEFSAKRIHLLAQKCWQLIVNGKMNTIDMQKIEADLKILLHEKDFNMYAYARKFI
jgi:LAO/AO transport system kinase